MMLFAPINTNIAFHWIPPCGMVSIELSERNRFPIMALLALQALDSAFVSLGGRSEQGTQGAGMTWSSIPKRLPMEVDRCVFFSQSSVYLLGLSKHKVIGMT